MTQRQLAKKIEAEFNLHRANSLTALYEYATLTRYEGGKSKEEQEKALIAIGEVIRKQRYDIEVAMAAIMAEQRKNAELRQLSLFGKQVYI